VIARTLGRGTLKCRIPRGAFSHACRAKGPDKYLRHAEVSYLGSEPYDAMAPASGDEH